MNIIISCFFIISIIYSFLNGTASEIFSIITSSLNECSSFVVQLIFIAAFYSGLMNVAAKSGVTDRLGYFIRKLTNKIFKTKNPVALDKITLNISANILGIGNAATPLGLMAMKELDKENHSVYPSYDMCKFIAFNTCSVQLIPTTIISLRALHGSQNPSAVMLPILITSFSSLIFALTFLKTATLLTNRERTINFENTSNISSTPDLF